MKNINRAKEFAKHMHTGHFRLNGESCYDHTIRVYQKLIEANIADETILITALLHTVDVSTAKINTNFGNEVFLLVKQYQSLRDKTIQQGSSLNSNDKYIMQTFLKLAKDMRVLIVRMANRVINIETAIILPTDKRVRTSERALYIYSPICRFIGANKFGNVLEDEAFKILQPKVYYQVKKVVRKRTTGVDKIFADIEKVVVQLLKEGGIAAKFSKRIKHIYGIYKKTIQRNLLYPTFNDLEDIVAMRFIVDSVENCYKTETILSGLFIPIEKSFNDYIHKPKPSGYRSLHNSYLIENNLVAEVQIRTQEMHEESEFGAASHLFYKLGAKLKKQLTSNPLLLKELVAWKNPSAEKNYLIDSFKGNIYVLTPKGDIIELPAKSTPIDFAYAIHAKLGNSCIGCKINEKIAKLNTALKDGDLVEINTLKSKKLPSPDWLETVKTHKAKITIRKALKN